jgi:hypothetical protein
MRYVVILLAVVAVLAASVVSLASSRPASASTHRISFVLLNFTPTNDVNTPPKGDGGFGPGDILTAHSTIYDASGNTRIGRTSERCIGTVHHPLTFDCSFGLIFRNDGSELLVEGHFNPSHTPWRGIIVGGTGRWLGASGQVRETDLPGGERMTLTLVR